MLCVFYIITVLIISIFVHELSHLFAALICKIHVKTFSIGFGKPFYKRIINGTNYQITPILLGGYVDLSGERDDAPNGFLLTKYRNKLILLFAGVSANLLLALLCFQSYFGNWFEGLNLSTQYCLSLFTNHHFNSLLLFRETGNDYLLTLGVTNLLCFYFNLIPIPPTDGSLMIIYTLPSKLKQSILDILSKRWFMYFTYGWQIILVIIINLK